jgi:hypothetical protein
VSKKSKNNGGPFAVCDLFVIDNVMSCRTEDRREKGTKERSESERQTGSFF